ncbi:unnamed protein product [Fraxinus pennsylvanica]|uniref:VAL1-3 N-terminal zinc finger domain-containing protein n=1 Tax=Fraxinus pennsylvanica TaxID=56036 RepID=A0AAD2DXL3_9LAMI|nr:unnamed protein product [Fraxinus pennsylvanica]
MTHTFLYQQVSSMRGSGKFFFSGISYLSKSQEEKALTWLNSVYKDESSDLLPSLKASADTLLIRMEDILFEERMKIKIGEWCSGLLHNTNEGSPFAFLREFHLKAYGWSCCGSCGKQIHCGCIVSFHMFILLDAGGIECLTCAKKSYILMPLLAVGTYILG